MVEMHYIFLITAVLLIVSVFANQLAEKINFPALLLFLLVGMLAGSEGIGGIQFDNAAVANAVGTLALAFILFAGGLDTRWKNIRPVLMPGLLLATVGVAGTAVLVGLFVHFALGFPVIEAFLLGAIVSSTDAAAVFVILRSKRMRLDVNLTSLLELESGSNDPMAVFLTLSMLQVLKNPSDPLWQMIPQFFIQMALGGFFGFVMGRAACWLFNRLKLNFEGLYPVVSIGTVLLVFGASDTIGGNGFLSVYVCGVVMGNNSFLYKGSLLKFHDGLSWLMQIAMFLILGLLVFPSHLMPVAGNGLLISLFLIIIARPLVTFLAMIKSGFGFREQLFVGWAGLRGAVPIILATFPLIAGYRKSEMIFNLVFFIVLTSVLIQGKTLKLIARMLKLFQEVPEKPRYPIECENTGTMQNDMIEFEVAESAAVVGKRISDLKLPEGVLIVLIRREEQFLIPKGTMAFKSGDGVLILGEPDSIDKLEGLFLRESPSG
jgi:cell volume regulation protein A